MDYQELLKKLKEIKEQGFIKTHRAGDTGIGKTLEDLLGIKENNVPGPNAKLIELKSARKGSQSMLTLFTKSPFPRSTKKVKGSIANLLEKFGYVEKGKKMLHVTLKSTSFVNIKGKPSLKVDVKDNRIEILSHDGEVMGYWDMDMLEEVFNQKLPAIIYVKAECRGKGENEEFCFNEAWYLKGFDFANFKELIKNDTILIDLRIGRYPNGRPHDHGTGFRVNPDKLELCFRERQKIL